MNTPLMPKATAVWLIENTSLTFEQIAGFCGLHSLEVQGIADGEVARGILGVDPTASGQLSLDEIQRCEKNPTLRLKMSETAVKHSTIEKRNKKVGKYTPVARRQDKPDAIAWLLKNCPEISDQQIVKLIGTTKSTIESVRSKSHWNAQSIRPKDPVLLGLCSQTELDKVYALACKRAEQRQKEEITKELDDKIGAS
jgi:hypothetical protein